MIIPALTKTPVIFGGFVFFSYFTFSDLIIEGPDDKDGYERVRAAIAVLRPKRTGLEAERKSVVKPYNDTVKLINGEYEKITTLIQEGPEVLPPLKFITFCIFQF